MAAKLLDTACKFPKIKNTAGFVLKSLRIGGEKEEWMKLPFFKSLWMTRKFRPEIG